MRFALVMSAHMRASAAAMRVVSRNPPPAAASAVRLSGDETAMSMSAKAIMWGTWETIA